MRHVVITGADGFIGSHLIQGFSERDITIYAIVHPKSTTKSRLQDISNVNIMEADCSEYGALSDKIPAQPMAFFHLAWAGVAPEQRNDTKLQISNVELALAATELAGKLRAQRFILPGSTMEYAYCGQLINETACPSPQNAYGAAKIAARYLCAAACEEVGVPYIYCVITGIYSADRTDNNVIYYTIRELLNGRRPSLTRLEQRWDYIHIDDLALALSLIAEKGRGGAFYSIGHGDNWPLANYIYQIRDIIDPSLPLGIGEIPYKDERLPSSCTDLSALRKDTGFEPQIPFDIGIRAVIDRVKEQSGQ